MYIHTQKRENERAGGKEKDEPWGAWGAVTALSHKRVFTSIAAPNFNQAVCIYSRAAFINGGINDTLLQHKHEGVWRLRLVREQMQCRWGRLMDSRRAFMRVFVCVCTVILICLGPDQESQALS